MRNGRRPLNFKGFCEKQLEAFHYMANNRQFEANKNEGHN